MKTYLGPQVVLLVLFLSVCMNGCNSSSSFISRTEFWVSPQGSDNSPGTAAKPFLTLERARDAVRSLGGGQRDGDIIITLRGGIYRLERPLSLDWRDSGHYGHPVLYHAAPGERPVISGSARITGWSLHDQARGIYKAYAGQRESRQLYVNGQRAVRARTSDNPAGFRPAYFYRDGTAQPVGIEFIPSTVNSQAWRDPTTWGNPQDIDAVIVTQWKMMSVPIQSVVPSPQHTPAPVFMPYTSISPKPGTKTGLINLKEPAWSNANIFLAKNTNQPGFWSFWQVTRFENAYEFLDEPGEWYLDKASGMIYYIPRPGEDLTSAEVELPVLESLIDGMGALSQPVSHIRFEGLMFSYATWLEPGGNNGYVSDQSGFRLAGRQTATNIIGHVPEVVRTAGNIRFRFARNIEFDSNVFAHLGGAGLDFDTGCQGNTIKNNRFTDISAAAIQLGGVSKDDHHPALEEQITQDNTITNNIVRLAGQEYVDAAGIFVGFTRRTLISNNTITDVPWSGIAMGWGWGLLDPGMFPGVPDAVRGEWGTYTTPTPNSGNRIINNLIERFLMALWDGGAIYTTGSQGTSMDDALLIEGNVAHGKRPEAGGNVYYTDGGSRYVMLKNNVSYDNPTGFTYFGPPSDKNDPYPYPPYSALNGIPYGFDSGGCRTYGNITFIGNYWSNLWFYDICPYWDENNVFYPTHMNYLSNYLIRGVADVPRSLLDGAGVKNFPQQNMGF